MVSERSSRSHSGADHAARRAAGAQDQHALVRERDIQVVLEVANEADAVGVVAEQLRILEERDGIHRLRARRARRQLVDQLCGRLLVRQRDVEATHAAGEQAQSLAPEIVGMYVEQPIDEVLRRGFGEHPVDERRPAVRDRMADQSILISRPGFMRQTHGLSHPAARFAK